MCKPCTRSLCLSLQSPKDIPPASDNTQNLCNFLNCMQPNLPSRPAAAAMQRIMKEEGGRPAVTLCRETPPSPARPGKTYILVTPQTPAPMHCRAYSRLSFQAVEYNIQHSLQIRSLLAPTSVEVSCLCHSACLYIHVHLIFDKQTNYKSGVSLS